MNGGRKEGRLGLSNLRVKRESFGMCCVLWHPCLVFIFHLSQRDPLLLLWRFSFVVCSDSFFPFAPPLSEPHLPAPLLSSLLVLDVFLFSQRRARKRDVVGPALSAFGC